MALGAAPMLSEPPMEMPRQPLGDERRNDSVDVTGSVADGERDARSFELAAIDAQNGRQHELYTGKLKIFGAQWFHAAPPCRRAVRGGPAFTAANRRFAAEPICSAATAPLSSACRSTFPVPVLGSSGRNAISRGYL